jgi:hypothetical protein
MIRAVRDLRSDIGAGIRRDYDARLAFLASLEIRPVIHFLWLQKLLNVAISCNIDTVYGEGIIGLRVIQKLTHCFEEGDDSLEDELRCNRLRSTKYCDAIRTLFKEKPYLSQKRISNILTIHRTIVKYVFVKISCSEKLISNGFLVSSMIIKSQKGLDSQQSSCGC